MTIPDTERCLFPRGLVQPEGSFRFSTDALLLAAFMPPGEGEKRLLDLGTGCGIVALAMLLRYPGLEAVGLDIQENLLLAAEENAARLGLSGRFKTFIGDAGEYPFEEGSFDLVVCNPPYRQAGKGRVSLSVSRRKALFEGVEGVRPFCRAAASALRANGRLAIIYPTARQKELLGNLRAFGFSPSGLMHIHTRTTKAPRLTLVEAVRTGRSRPREPVSLSPLVLHEGEGEKTKFHPTALVFCPEIACSVEGRAPFIDNETKTDVLQKPEDCPHG